VIAGDAAEKVSAHVFEIKGKVAPIATFVISAKITHICCSPFDDDKFATCGKGHMNICDVKTKKTQKGAFGK